MSLANTGALDDVLRTLGHLDDLDDLQLLELARAADLRQAPRGTRLLALGSEEPQVLFLLHGEIELLAADGASHCVSHTSPAAQRPISRLRPSRYQVTALTEVSYLLLEGRALDDALSPAPVASVQFDEIPLGQAAAPAGVEDTGHPLLFDVFEDLHRGAIVVPSVPEVAIEIGRTLQQLGSDPRRLASTLAICPALTLKVVRAAMANKRNPRAIRSCREAVKRLGADQTLGLTVNCVLRETLRSDPGSVRDRLFEWWQRTMRIAAISRSLARVSERFDPEFAALIGLLHSIAEPVLLGYAEQHPDLEEPQRLDEVVLQNRADLGRILLTFWGLPAEVVEAAHVCNDWQHRQDGEAGYIDILLVAQWHAMAGDDAGRHLPPSDKIPAFERLGVQRASPALRQDIAEATREIRERVDTLLDG